MAGLSLIVVKCQNCKEVFEARVADRKRGWGRFCSKSCKAKKQEAKTGQMSKYLSKRRSLSLYEDEGFYANFSNEDNTDV